MAGREDQGSNFFVLPFPCAHPSPASPVAPLSFPQGNLFFLLLIFTIYPLFFFLSFCFLLLQICLLFVGIMSTFEPGLFQILSIISSIRSSCTSSIQ